MASIHPTAVRLRISMGDITRIEVDAIVNAASHSLVGCSGLSGAILRAGGPELVDECASLGGCESGNAKVTRAYRLPAKHVIHAVGPVWYGGIEGEEETLAKCYRQCLALAETHGHRSIAFPAIGTGAHSFPTDRAARIAVYEMVRFLGTNFTVETIHVVCFDRATFECYRAVLPADGAARIRYELTDLDLLS